MHVQSIRIFQITFSTLAALTFIIGCAALFTPGWRSVLAQSTLTVAQSQLTVSIAFEAHLGLFGFLCSQNVNMEGGNLENNSVPTNLHFDVCSDWANKQQTFEQIVPVLLAIALVCSLLALAWSLLILFGIFSDWSKSRWLLPPFSGASTILLAVALVLFFVNGCRHEEYGSLPIGWKTSSCSLGYSFFLAMAAAVFALLATIVGAIVVVLHRRIARGTNYPWN